MTKTIDMTKNVSSLCDEYPELIDILADAGFKPIKNPIMRKTVATKITIPDAARIMSIPMSKILFAFAKNGFSVTGLKSSSDHAEAGLKEDHTKYRREPGHAFLARLGKTRLRPGGIDATNWLLEQAHITPGAKILEVACNMGTTLIQIAEKYDCSLTGLDLDPRALDHARENIKKHNLENRITLVQGSAFKLPFPDNSFDVVINEAMLTMLTGSQKDQAISEYHRVLKEGGILLTQDVCLRTEDQEEQKNIRAGISRAINVNVEPLTAEGWKQKFEGNGFTTEQIQGPMTLMDPAGMEHDEGSERTLEILTNGLKPENAEFFMRMFTFFTTNRDKLGFIAVASHKN